MTFRDYSVFGLRVRSEIPLPELFEAAAGDADVTVRRGSTCVTGEYDSGLHPVEGGLLFVEPEVGRYRILGGREIIVEARPGVPDRNVRLFLLGSAFGALLHQRGMLPLHANAVEIAGKAFAFMGPSGEGKSTLAAAFHDRGYRIIADDVCVVGFDGEGVAHAYPGLPRLRLWDEVLVSMGHDADYYERSYVGMTTQLEKFDVPIDRSAAADSHVPLAALCLLDRGDMLSIDRIDGLEATEAVFANTYRGSYVATAGNHVDHWFAAVRLVRNVPVFRASREWDLAKLDDQCRQLLKALKAHVGPQAASMGQAE
jgi:hypothetical protein